MQTNKDLNGTLGGDPRFSTFARLLQSSNAAAVLDGDGEFTVFAPTDEAFSKVPRAVMSKWMNEPGQKILRSLLQYHMVPGRILAGDIATAAARMSSAGEEIRFTDNHGIKVNESSVISQNILATNGVVHALDTVLIRPSEFLTLFPLTPMHADVPKAIPVMSPEADKVITPVAASRTRTRRARFVL
jgi:uncharacterized surface protein with fasciclin (FAS1) repeats